MVPFGPTPRRIVRSMLELARVTPRDLLYDLGAGDGRILAIASEEFGARAHGIELNPIRYRNIQQRWVRPSGRISAEQTSFYTAPLGMADVVTLYLTPAANQRIAAKLSTELRPGARVICHEYPLPKWRPATTQVVYEGTEAHYLYLYRVGVNACSQRAQALAVRNVRYSSSSYGVGVGHWGSNDTNMGPATTT